MRTHAAQNTQPPAPDADQIGEITVLAGQVPAFRVASRYGITDSTVKRLWTYMGAAPE